MKQIRILLGVGLLAAAISTTALAQSNTPPIAPPVDPAVQQAISNLPPLWQHYAVVAVSILTLLGILGRTIAALLQSGSLAIGIKAAFLGSAQATTPPAKPSCSIGGLSPVILACLCAATLLTGCIGQHVRFGVIGNGIGIQDRVVSTNAAGALVTNSWSYRLVVPINLTNAVQGLVAEEVPGL